MIDRESIKSKIRLAIQQLPSQGVVYREKLDDYNSKIGLEEITILEGLFYTSERASTILINFLHTYSSHLNFSSIDYIGIVSKSMYF